MVDGQFEKDLKRKSARQKSASDGASSEPVEKSEQDLKADRLAEALRENLHKRKEQARARDEADTKDAGGSNEGP